MFKIKLLEISHFELRLRIHDISAEVIVHYQVQWEMNVVNFIYLIIINMIETNNSVTLTF